MRLQWCRLSLRNQADAEMTESARRPLPRIKVCILAAGYGTRLERDIREDSSGAFNHLIGVPKPLLPVAGRPLLSHWLASLDNAGISRHDVFVLGNSYNNERLKAWALESGLPKENVLDDGRSSNETRRGAVADLHWMLTEHLSLASSSLHDSINGWDGLLIVGGDTLFYPDFSPSTFLASFAHDVRSHPPPHHHLRRSHILCYSVDPSMRHKYGILETDDLTGLVRAFKEKPSLGETESTKACPCFYLLTPHALQLVSAILQSARRVEEMDAPGLLLRRICAHNQEVDARAGASESSSAANTDPSPSPPPQDNHPPLLSSEQLSAIQRLRHLRVTPTQQCHRFMLRDGMLVRFGNIGSPISQRDLAGARELHFSPQMPLNDMQLRGLVYWDPPLVELDALLEETFRSHMHVHPESETNKLKEANCNDLNRQVINDFRTLCNEPRLAKLCVLVCSGVLVSLAEMWECSEIHANMDDLAYGFSMYRPIAPELSSQSNAEAMLMLGGSDSASSAANTDASSTTTTPPPTPLSYPLPLVAHPINGRFDIGGLDSYIACNQWFQQHEGGKPPKADKQNNNESTVPHTTTSGSS